MPTLFRFASALYSRYGNSMIDRRFYTVAAPMRLGDLADAVGAELPDPSMSDDMIRSPSALATSLPGNIAFFGDKRRKATLLTAKASACLTTQALAPHVTPTQMIALIVDDPRSAFARLSARMVQEGPSEPLESQIDPTASIHPSAIIGQGVQIGPRTRIGAQCVIESGVKIGADCLIEPLVRISFAHLGDSCRIKSFAVIGGSGFGLVQDSEGHFAIPHLGRVIIHNRVHIGSNSCVDRGQLGDTIIAMDVKIDNLVQVGHNVFIDEGAVIAGHSGISGSCVIGKRALLGGRASLADHVTVGDGAMIAAFAGVMSDIPPGETYSGAPAMPIREHMRNVATLKKLTKRR